MISEHTLRERTFVAKPREMQDKALLFVDIDAVISLAGSASDACPAGAFHDVDEVIGFLSFDATAHLLTPAEGVDLVSCRGRVRRPRSICRTHVLYPPGRRFSRSRAMRAG